MLTVQDIIHLIQWYYKNSASIDNVTSDVESFRLESLRGASVARLAPAVISLTRCAGVEKDLGVAPPPLLSEHPSSSMFEAARRLVQTHARRLPLLDFDSDTGHEVIVSVLTTYRLLKFISINVRRPSRPRLGRC
jgi:5'-AMP-activated protein kinase regulatory gamma subunit